MPLFSEETSSSSSQRLIPAGTKVYFRWTDRMAKNSHNEMGLEHVLDSRLHERNIALVDQSADPSPSFPALLLLLLMAMMFITCFFLIRLLRIVCCRSNLAHDIDKDVELARGGKRAGRNSRRAVQVVLVPKKAQKASMQENCSVRRKSTSSVYKMVHQPIDGLSENLEFARHYIRAAHGSGRALQVVLVAKGMQKSVHQRHSVRSKSASSVYSMMHPFDVTNERKLTTLSMLQDGKYAMPKPYPRRIYELQAGE